MFSVVSVILSMEQGSLSHDVLGQVGRTPRPAGGETETRGRRVITPPTGRLSCQKKKKIVVYN